MPGSLFAIPCCMKRSGHRGISRLFAFLAAACLCAAAPALSSEVQPSFLYNLSNFTGTVPYNWARVSVSEGKDEVYVISGGTVRIFNERGMEIYRFGEDAEFGVIADLAANKEGDIYVLSYKGSKSVITRCNFRGVPQATIEVKKLPQELPDFRPERMILRLDRLYLASPGDMRVVVADTGGDIKEIHDLAALAGISDAEREESGIVGFSVGSDGTLLFTIPAVGKAYVVTPDKQVRAFGKRGSTAGSFGVPAGITADKTGSYYLVADTLRCVVLVFDKNLAFVTEFGYRGSRSGNLIGPRELAIDSNSRVYVSQLRNRGVSVFKVMNN